MSKRTNTRNAFETQLTAGIVSGTTTITLDSVSGLIDPLYLVIDPDSSTKREYIRADGIAGSQLTSVTRGLDGSAAGAQDHDAGTRVRAVATHQLVSDLFDDIETIETDIAALEAADTAHFGGTDTADHPEATPGVRGFMSAADKTKLDNLNITDQVTGGDNHDHVGGDGAQIDHGGLAGLADDDHTQYLTVARHLGEAAFMRINKSTPQNIPDDVTTVITNYQSILQEVDPGGFLSANLTNGTISVNTAGLYIATAGVTWDIDLPALTGELTEGSYLISIAAGGTGQGSVSTVGHHTVDIGTGPIQFVTVVFWAAGALAVDVRVDQVGTGNDPFPILGAVLTVAKVV